MYLTEEQKLHSEDLFMSLVEAVADEYYDMNEEYEMTDEDAYITSIFMEHFVENYKHLTLKESAYQALTGVDANEALYEEMITMMLDESLGSFVAGAAHGYKNYIAKRKNIKAGKAATSAGAKQQSIGRKKSSAARKFTGKEYSAKSTKVKASGLKGTYQQSKLDTLISKHHSAQELTKHLQKHQRDTKSALDTHHQHTKDLASKIDSHISALKDKVKSTVTSGAHKLASVAGRVAGSI